MLVIFELADDVHEGTVSVVGSFNQWTPEVHVLELQQDGQRNVTVTVDPDLDLYFRYLGPGGVWFDDPAAERTECGSILRVVKPEPTAVGGAFSEPDSAPPLSAAKRGKGEPPTLERYELNQP